MEKEKDIRNILDYIKYRIAAMKKLMKAMNKYRREVKKFVQSKTH
jgi:hypothetical protein